MSIADEPRCRGRRRDASIDARVLAVANRHLATRGFEALSLAAVAEEACTTRQALYRRWPTKESLLADAIRSAADTTSRPSTGDPRRDLELELADFAKSINRPGAMSIVGTMLQESTPADSRACYRAHVVEPRLARIRTILERARTQELTTPEADLELAVTLATGAWYARELAGDDPPGDWAKRTAALVWRAVAK